LQAGPVKPELQMQVPLNCAEPWPLHVVASPYWQNGPV